MTEDGDLAAYREHAHALADAVDEALDGWITALVTSRAPGTEVAGVVAAVRTQVVPALHRFAEEDPDRPSTTPLSLLRAAMAPVTRLLDDAGVPRPARDEVDARIDPEDVHALGPIAFADLGPAVAEAGLVWGAAKAHVHLRRRRVGQGEGR